MVISPNEACQRARSSKWQSWNSDPNEENKSAKINWAFHSGPPAQPPRWRHLLLWGTAYFVILKVGATAIVFWSRGPLHSMVTHLCQHPASPALTSQLHFPTSLYKTTPKSLTVFPLSNLIYGCNYELSFTRFVCQQIPFARQQHGHPSASPDS